MIQSYIFYFLSTIAILSGIMVVVSKNPIHSVLYLIITFFAIAGHYIMLNAQFLAAVHIIVYAGAIMVLFLFVIMLLNLNAETEPLKSNLLKFSGATAGGLLLLVLVAALKDMIISSTITNEASRANVGLVENLGQVLFKQFLLPFEVSSILFLAAIVGVVVLAKKENN